MFLCSSVSLSLSLPHPLLSEDPVPSSAPGGPRMRLSAAAITSESRGTALMQFTYVEQSQRCQLLNNTSDLLSELFFGIKTRKLSPYGTNLTFRV